MKKYSMIIKPKHSTIHTCECGIKFIEIQEELDLEYKRVKCPWCIPYQHNGVTPRLTHNGVPDALDMWELADKLRRFK